MVDCRRTPTQAVQRKPSGRNGRKNGMLSSPPVATVARQWLVADIFFVASGLPTAWQR